MFVHIADGLNAAGLAAEHRVERRDAVDVRVRQVERARDQPQRVVGEMTELFLGQVQRGEDHRLLAPRDLVSLAKRRNLFRGVCGEFE